uniref:Venom protein family 2 protein 5 n=1 Tax=Platymeris rhadamanthus TaxID=1134088 RepID=A0A6B9KZ28_PLARH|nr:venom protein family 2 protein 5 [Platymeris rhadamanthus]
MFKLDLLLMIFGASCLLFSQASILTDEEKRALADAPLIPVKFRGHSQVTGRSIEDTLRELKKKCKCQGKICGCCTEFEVSFLTVEGCAKISIIPEEKAFEVFLSAANKPVIKHKISARQLEKICGSIANVKELEICMSTTLDEDKPNEITSCLSIDIVYEEILIANFNFECLKYADNQLTFIENTKTENDALINLKVKSPFHLVAKIIKVLINKLEEA